MAPLGLSWGISGLVFFNSDELRKWQFWYQNYIIFLINVVIVSNILTLGKKCATGGTWSQNCFENTQSCFHFWRGNGSQVDLLEITSDNGGAYIGNFIFWRKKIVQSLKVLLFICTFWQIQIQIRQMRKYTYPFRQIQLLVLEDAGWVGPTQDAAAATVGVKSRSRARECVGQHSLNLFFKKLNKY